MLIGFGGPEKPEEVRPFLESVLRGVKIPQARFEQVLRHYEVIGGVSPYNSITYRQMKALEIELRKRGIPAPVFIGFRHASPSLGDTLKRIQKAEINRVVGFVLSPLRSYASFGKYVERVEEARKKSGAGRIEFIYTEPFHDNPLFIQAQSDEAAKIIQKLSPAEKNKTFFIFSAHSIPAAMAQAGGYDRQFEVIATLIARRAGISSWAVAYQSRSGNPKDPWLEPSVEGLIKGVDRSKYKNVALVPAGFLCDNAEVIYDLDYEIKNLCQSIGLSYVRAKTVTDHPQFIRLMADLVEAKL